MVQKATVWLDAFVYNNKSDKGCFMGTKLSKINLSDLVQTCLYGTEGYCTYCCIPGYNKSDEGILWVQNYHYLKSISLT